MSSEPHNSIPNNGVEASGSGTNGWPVRTDKSSEWWGRRQDVPIQGDRSRLNMFVKPFEMSQEEKSRIIANWQKVAKDWPETRAMNPELRPSTPREIRADRKIQKLREEGVEVDTHMERHIRNVILKNSGLHEALRHYTEGESSELIPYMNEMLHREDRMFVEWAKQRQADYQFFEHASYHGGSSRGARGLAKSSPQPPSPASSDARPYEELQAQDDDSPMERFFPSVSSGPLRVTNPGQDEGDAQGSENFAEQSPQHESAEPSRAQNNLAQAREVSEAEHVEDQNGMIQMILDVEGQIADIDRRLHALKDKTKSSAPVANLWFDQREPFNRIFELMRSVLEEKQRRLCKLNQQMSNKAKSGENGIIGVCRSAWRRCIDGTGTNYSSPNGSQLDPREHR